MMFATRLVSLSGLLLLLAAAWPVRPALAQAGECVYPVIFLHGWIGNQFSFEGVYSDAQFAALWGGIDPNANDHIFHVVANATEDTRLNGPDGVLGTSDDDVLTAFVSDLAGNSVNNLQPGCVYAINFENWWNENAASPMLDRNGGDSPSLFDSDSNESAILKQGYALKRMIEAVLAANPTKQKVVLVGHSMGGLTGREYLQRRTPDALTGTPRWWVDPVATDGHKVAKLVTMGTPHRGSNLLGNISTPQDETPDLASEAVRDLRYSYACGFLFLDDCSAPYLFGGDEDDIPFLPYPFWNDDVNCDGDESDLLEGLNVDGRDSGQGDEWDGTYDNPAFPLPTTLTYTYYTADTFLPGEGDDVVDLNRQYVYQVLGGQKVPVPNDGTNWRLSDTLKTSRTHLAQNEDVDGVIRGIDEGNYPAHAWALNVATDYAALPQWRSTNVPDGQPRNDRDWFTFTLSTASRVTLTLTPTPGLSGRLDLYQRTPQPYSDANSAVNRTFTGTSGTVTLSSTRRLNPGTYYVRVRHDNVTMTSWHTPYRLRVDLTAAPASEPLVAGKAVETPATFILEQNYPNPFNPATVIGFTLPEAGTVSLKVYNLLGQAVATLADGTFEAGRHEVRFDATALSAGTYLYRLEAGPTVQTRHLTLVK
jgi:pimeloyl-ACP methyl ester carboxylesterase